MEALSYDPTTGRFVWKKKVSDKVTVGQPAGSATDVDYIRISFKGRKYYAHVLTWAFTHGAWPARRIDHKDRDCSNNRIENLRQAEAWQNAHNSPIQSNNTSKVRGVHWDTERQRWMVQVRAYGKIVYSKRFASFDEATKNATAVRAKVAGEFFYG